MKIVKILYLVGLCLMLPISMEAGGKTVEPAISPIVEIPQLSDPSPWYLGAGLVRLRYYGCRSSCEFEDITYGMMMRGGYEYNRYIGIEGRAMWTGWEDEGAALKHHFGIFLKPMVPVGEDFNLYGLVGYGHTKIGGDYARAALDESGFSWGVGFEYDLSDREHDREDNVRYDREFDGQADQERGWGLFIDYQRLLVGKQNVGGGDVDLDVISFGITYDF